MLLAVDVGNTHTHLGAFSNEELVRRWRMATVGQATADELAAALSSMLSLDGVDLGAIDGAIVSTVVPQLGPEYEALCERHLRGPCMTVGPHLRTGMPIRIDNPRELGSDRLVNAVAAYERAGGACVTVDFGTSTNFDVVSAGGEYLGGAIGPGVAISLEALHARAAKLPRIEIAQPEEAIGRHTQGAILSGFGFGFGGLVDGINRRLVAELEDEPTVIATGGLAPTIAPLCETIDLVDDLLTLRGLRLIHAMNS